MNHSKNWWTVSPTANVCDGPCCSCSLLGGLRQDFFMWAFAKLPPASWSKCKGHRLGFTHTPPCQPMVVAKL